MQSVRKGEILKEMFSGVCNRMCCVVLKMGKIICPDGDGTFQLHFKLEIKSY